MMNKTNLALLAAVVLLPLLVRPQGLFGIR